MNKENNATVANNNGGVTNGTAGANATGAIDGAVAELLAKASDKVKAFVNDHESEWNGMTSEEKLSYLARNQVSASKVELPDVEACAESTMVEEQRVTGEAVAEAMERGNNATNPIRNGEILIADECEGNMSAFKKALKDGLVIRPEGLEAVSFHCAGFTQRDEGLVAKQFAVTLKVNGKWQPLSRYAASGKGGHFAMGASQTLKGAKTLAAMLKAVWINGQDISKKGKKTAK